MQQLKKEQLETLVSLQEIETESNKIKQKLERLPDKLNVLESRLNEFQQSIENDEALLTELKKQYRVHESDVQTNLDRMKKSQEKLRSVKTNKEYQSSLKEIDDLKVANSRIEDQMLECLDQMEEIEKRIASKNKDYLDISEQAGQEREKIQQEAEEGNKELSVLENDWYEISKRLEPELLNKFEMIKKQQASGSAVVPVKDAVCLGCNMNIPPQMYNELQRFDSLRFCPFCQRIIYWKDA
jgi:predicted  nucleic acid-binding Zn-ribbon protein